MKVFHQDRARRKGIAVGVLAASMLASVLSLAPAAHAQPNWLELDSCDEDDLIEAVEIANDEDDIDTIVIDKKKCKFEFELPYNDGGFTANALPLVTDDLTIYGNRAEMENDGDFFMRFLEAAPDVDVELRDMTIEDFVVRIPGSSADPLAAGGAILMDGGDLTLRNVTLEDNEVIVLDADGADLIGGGAIASLGGSVTLRSTTLKGNEVSLVNLSAPGLTIAAAGGVGVDGDDESVLRIESSTVKGNKVSATGLGGANALAGAGGVAAIDGAQLVMTGSSVTSNSVSARAGNAATLAVAEAGGVFVDDTGDDDGHTISSSKIDGNKASAEGGAIAAAIGGGLINLDEDGPSDDADAADGLVMTGGSISSNKATCDDVCLAVGGGYTNTDALAGGDSGTATFNGTVFKSNVADGDDGIGLGGGLYLTGDDAEPAETVLNDATVTKNSAKGDAFAAGGGIFVDGGPDDVDVNDSVINKNKPEDCATLDGEFFCGDL